jgi:hypothetical protein
MEQVYCELPEDSASRLKLPMYVTFDNTNLISYLRVLNSADRAWAQDGSRVVFAKNRHSDAATTKVDMEEFMWIKLKSKSI